MKLHLLMLMLLAAGPAIAREPKPPKLPVAIGKWTGPSAGTFKSGLRKGLAKDCTTVSPGKARVIIDGEVTSDDKKHFSLKVIVKSPKSGEVVEQREYAFSKPSVSAAQSNKMGREVAEMVRRSPE